MTDKVLFKAPAILSCNFKTSKYSFVFQNGNYYALYHSLLLKYVYLNQTSFNVFKKIKSQIATKDILNKYKIEEWDQVIGVINSLYQNRLIILQSENEKFLNKSKLLNIGIDIHTMYLILTDSCNLKCKYCFIENSLPFDHINNNMSIQTLSKSVDLFKKLSRNQSHYNKIIFYGGEPLLNREILYQGVIIVREHLGKKTDINLITNGIGITRKDANFFKENKVKISISIDGLESINNKARVFNNNKNSYSSIVKGYNNLKFVGYNEIGASITLGKHNIKNLQKNIELLLEKFDFKTIGFNFLMDFPNCKNPFAIDMDLATTEVLKTFEFLRKKGIYEDRIMRKLKPFLEEKIHLKDCCAIGNQIVISPDGEIGPCHGFLYNKKYFSQEIDEVDTIYSNGDFIEWSKRFPINMEKCDNCVAIGICGGGCPYQAYINKGSIWELDERMCQHNKIFLEWAIWDVFNNNKFLDKKEKSN